MTSKMPRLFAIGAGLLASVIVAACDDDTTPPGGLSGDLAAAEAQLRPIIDAQCEWLFGCCNGDEVAYELGPFVADAADCAERVLEQLRAGQRYPTQSSVVAPGAAQLIAYMGYGFGNGRVDVDSGAVSACADHLRNRACNEPVSEPGEYCVPPAPPDTSDVCDMRKILIGKQGPGAACTADVQVECAPGLWCVEFGNQGICVDAIGEGDSCFADYICEGPLLCDFTTGTCAMPSPFGGECSFTDPENPKPGTEAKRCAEGLACDPDSLKCTTASCLVGSYCYEDAMCPQGTQCVANECGQLHDAGERCYSHDDCTTNRCDYNTSTCVAARVDGATCSSADECASQFCDYQLGQCASPVAPGELCPTADDDQCAGGYCDTSLVEFTCAAYVAVGGACPNGNECDEDGDVRCVSGSCAALPLDDGATCYGNPDCTSKLCWQGECTPPTAAGGSCAFDGSIPPCESSTYCDAGTCTAFREPGEVCDGDEQCFGGCQTRFNERRCSAEAAPGGGYCDG